MPIAAKEPDSPTASASGANACCSSALTSRTGSNGNTHGESVESAPAA